MLTHQEMMRFSSYVNDGAQLAPRVWFDR